MTIGCIIRDNTTGNTLLDSTTGLSRVLGTVTTTSGQVGSISHEGFGSGTSFATISFQSVPDFTASDTFPILTLSGTTLSWTAGTVVGTIVYGVYAGVEAGHTGSGSIGFRVLNNGQATQIDSLYANHALLTTGVVNLPLGGSMTFTVTATAPIVAYRGTGVIGPESVANNGDGTWTIGLAGSKTTSTVGTYYVFDTVSANSKYYNSTIGMIIRNPATGVKTYDSRYKYMRILSDGVIEAGSLPNYIVTSTLPQDNCAVIVNPGLWSFETTTYSSAGGEPIESDTYHFYIGAAGVDGTTLSVTGIGSYGESSNVQPAQQDAAGQYFIVDVSGF